MQLYWSFLSNHWCPSFVIDRIKIIKIHRNLCLVWFFTYMHLLSRDVICETDNGQFVMALCCSIEIGGARGVFFFFFFFFFGGGG